MVFFRGDQMDQVVRLGVLVHCMSLYPESLSMILIIGLSGLKLIINSPRSYSCSVAECCIKQQPTKEIRPNSTVSLFTANKELHILVNILTYSHRTK